MKLPDRILEFSLIGGTEEQREFLYEQYTDEIFSFNFEGFECKYKIVRPTPPEEKLRSKPVAHFDEVQIDSREVKHLACSENCPHRYSDEECICTADLY